MRHVAGVRFTRCGIGSTEVYTRKLRLFFRECIKKYDLKKVSDVGCGDLFWITLEDYDIDYTGYDDLVRETARERLKAGWKIEKADAITNLVRKSDLIICKDVFRHHSRENITEIISNFKKSGSYYLLADYDSDDWNHGTHHKQLEDDSDYQCKGNKTDLRKYLGDPIDSVKSDFEGTYFGIWQINPLIESARG